MSPNLGRPLDLEPVLAGHVNASRVGRFMVGSNVLREGAWPRLLGLFEGILVYRATPAEFPGVIEYTAFSEHFEELRPGEPPPQYECDIGCTYSEAGELETMTYRWNRRP